MPQNRSNKADEYPLSEFETQRRIRNLIALGYIEKASDIPENAIPADTSTPAGDYYSLPVPFYVQEMYFCRDCGKKVVWTAFEKYEYYEIEKGNMYARRVRCDAGHHKGT